ncbi:MAG: hypothetical protein NWQ27_00760 [Crocinitomicaceae bacterium]|nr:hypothetical protein [Crocinitomicaceae bacterium]
MITSVHYYGMISEKLLKQTELIEMDNSMDSIDLKAFFNSLYPELKSTVYTIAVNQEVMEVAPKGLHISEIALLPPFAGG